MNARPHESAHLHVAGEATYVDDLPVLAGMLYAAPGLSSVAHGRLVALHLDAVRAAPGVVAVLTAADITGKNNCGPIVSDEPVLVSDVVSYVGQPLFLVLGTSVTAARRAARLARVDINPLSATLEPTEETPTVVPVMRLSRGDAATAMSAARHVVDLDFTIGGQEHFYLEGQVSTVVPTEDGTLTVYCSTQHPTEMQHLVAHAVGLHSNQVRVECRRMGGGFGGKESQSAQHACLAAVAALALKRPVKLRLDRDDDMLVTGKRHPFCHIGKVGFDAEGRVLAAQVTMISNAGFGADLSGPVMSRALCHLDNAYLLPHVDAVGRCARTNTQSNTAFRGFGGPQGAMAIEYALDTMARRLGKDALDLRLANLYPREGGSTPYGQPVLDNVLHELIPQLVSSSDYWARRQAVEWFNRSSPVLKRGLALTPVKFGISFNATHFNQAGALVHVYADGTVLVNHGGTEMGQGLFTKVQSVVASTLGVPVARVRCSATDTSKVPNTSATAASTGADLNGKAAQAAALTVRDRLAHLFARQHGVDAAAVHFEDGVVSAGLTRVPFTQVVAQAYLARVQLWSDGFYATPELHWNRDTMQGHPFYYFAYGASVSEVLIDTLTGETKLLRADLLHEAGSSLNTAIDIGQVEGGFLQGVGWLTSEELVWHSKTGKLLTHSPSTYKIPTANDCPDLRVTLWAGANRRETIGRSKAVGEPPLLLSFSAFFAIRDAIASVAAPGVAPSLRAPATPEAVLTALLAVSG